MLFSTENKGEITLGYTILFITMGLIFIAYGINECIKKFQIIDNKIIYKKLFISKIYDISDLTKIEYEKSYYNWNLYNLHTITGYIGKRKVCKAERFTPEKIKLLKEIIKKYNSNVKLINKK